VPENLAPAYTLTARVLHWIVAVLVLSMIPFGLIMVRLDAGPTQDLLFNLHRSIGAVLLPLMVVRLVWRLQHPPAPLPPEIPAIQRAAAHMTHGTLYVLLIAQSLIGWVATSAYRAPIGVFWIFELPPIWPEDRAFSEQLFAAHRYVGLAIAALVCAHIGAALFHHFVLRDRVLMRMVTG
jgi:cytochrome b561